MAGEVGEIVYSLQFLAVASSRGIYLYDAGTLAEVRLIETDTRVFGVALSPDGQALISGALDAMLETWRDMPDRGETGLHPLEVPTVPSIYCGSSQNRNGVEAKYV